MMLAVTNPSLPRSARPTPTDRLVVAVGRALEAAGRHLAQAQAARVEGRDLRRRAARSRLERQDAAVRQMRDNTAQNNPLGLR